MGSGITLDVHLPVGRIGNLRLDPLKTITGISIGDLFEAVRCGEIRQADLADIYPIRLPEGRGVNLDISVIGGELGIMSQDGHFKLTLPTQLASWAHNNLAQYAARGPELVTKPSGVTVVEVWILPTKGATVRLPVGVGEILFVVT